MENKVNQRLLCAYAALLEKPYEKISVTKLCEKADVSRATFYIHYSDLDAFIQKVKEYLLKKFCRQMEIIMLARDTELEELLKKENFVFNDTELNLLRSLALGNNYLDFAKSARKYVIKYSEVAKKYTGEAYYAENSVKLNYFFNGFFMLLYFSLIDYDEEKVKFEIFGARVIAKNLFSDILDKDNKDGKWYKTTRIIYK